MTVNLRCRFWEGTSHGGSMDWAFQTEVLSAEVLDWEWVWTVWLLEHNEQRRECIKYGRGVVKKKKKKGKSQVTKSLIDIVKNLKFKYNEKQNNLIFVCSIQWALKHSWNTSEIWCQLITQVSFNNSPNVSLFHCYSRRKPSQKEKTKHSS